MNPSTEVEALIGIAGVSATLLGAFLIGSFFYIESDEHRSAPTPTSSDRYLRSGLRWTFAVYSIPILVPLVLLAVGAQWGAATFVVLTAVLIAATVDTVRRILTPGGAAMSRSLVINEIVTTTAVVAIAGLPWLLGSGLPAIGDFAPSLLLCLACGLFSTVALVMTEFDLTRRSRLTRGGTDRPSKTGTAASSSEPD